MTGSAGGPPGLPGSVVRGEKHGVGLGSEAAGGQMIVPGDELILDFDASDLRTLQFNANDNAIVSWSNRRDFGGELTPVAYGNAPQYQAPTAWRQAGVRFENGDRTTDFLGLDMGSTYPFSSGVGSQNGVCLFAVVTPLMQRGAGPSFIVDFGNFTQGGWGLGIRPGEISGYAPSLYGGTSQRIASGEARVGQPIVLCVRYVFSSVWQIWANGVKLYEQSAGLALAALDSLQIDEAPTHSANSGPFTIGRPSESMVAADAGQCFNGIVHQIKMWRAALTEDDVLATMNELKLRWEAMPPTIESSLHTYVDLRHRDDLTLEAKTTTGTISTTTGSYSVTGTTTSFLTEVSPGDLIEVSPGGNDAELIRVYSVSSDTSLTLAAKARQTAALATFQIYQPRVSAVSSVTGSGFSQAIGGSKPGYYADDALHGNNVYFDGTDDFLSSTSAATNFRFLHDGTPWTMLWYGVQHEKTNLSAVASTLSAGFVDPGMLINRGDDSGADIANTIQASVFGAPLTPVAALSGRFDYFAHDMHVYAVDFERSGTTNTIRFFKDGILVGTDSRDVSVSSSDPGHTLELGSYDGALNTGHMRGTLGQVVIFNAKLSDEKRNQWTRWLARRNDLELFDNPKAQANNLAGWYDAQYLGAIDRKWEARTGTITLDMSVSSNIVTGSGTAFLSELGEGMKIRFVQDGEYVEFGVQAIISDTSLQITPDAQRSVLAGTSFERSLGLAQELDDKSATNNASNNAALAESELSAPIYNAPRFINGLRYAGSFVGNTITPLRLVANSFNVSQPFTIFGTIEHGFAFEDSHILGGNETWLAHNASLDRYQLSGGSEFTTSYKHTAPFNVFKAVFNGANSTISWAGAAPVTFDAGESGLDVLTLLSDSGGTNPTRASISEIRVFSGIVGATASAQQTQGMANKALAYYQSSPAACSNLRYWYDLTNYDFVSTAALTEDIASVFSAIDLSTLSGTGHAPAYRYDVRLANRAGIFDGAADYLSDIFTSPSFMYDGTGGTAVAVVVQTPATGGNRYIAGNGDSGVETGFGLFLRNTENSIRYRVRNAGTSRFLLRGDLTVPDGMPFIVQAELKGSVARIFVNGVLLDSDATVTDLPSPGSASYPLDIAAQGNGTGLLWNGSIAEVLFFDEALSESPTQQLIVNNYLRAKYPGTLS